MTDAVTESPIQRVVLLGAGASVGALGVGSGDLHKEFHGGASFPLYSTIADRLTQAEGFNPLDIERIARVLEHISLATNADSLARDLETMSFRWVNPPPGFRNQTAATLAEAATAELKAIREALKKRLWLPDESGDSAAGGEDRLAYLRPIVAAQRGSTIATLNYDNSLDLIEGVVTRQPYVGKRVTVPTVATDKTRVLKVHGSLDWRLIDEDVLATGHPHGRDTYDPAVVFGAGNKLRHYGPFLDLLREFRDALYIASHMITLGYGYRDPHVNEIIRLWILRAERASIPLVLSVGIGPTATTRFEFVDTLDKYECVTIHTWPGLAENLGPEKFGPLVTP